jgi:folate-binding protein YgfZ
MNIANSLGAPGVKTWIALPGRSVLSVGGSDARDFLQGLISSDLNKLESDNAIYGALLTPQGKFLHEFFLAELDGLILLDCERERRDDLIRRLSLYKLRADVAISDQADNYSVVALLGDHGLGALEGTAQTFGQGVAFVDPRLTELGARAILPATGAKATLEAAGYAEAGFDAYDGPRLALGVPDGSRDLSVEKSFLMESNFDELHGVDFEKGCYVGQEVTTRTKRRGLVKKRLFPVDVSGSLPSPGTAILLGDKEAGTMCSGSDGRGLALLKLEKVQEARETGSVFTSDGAELSANVPSWLDLDKTESETETS